MTRWRHDRRPLEVLAAALDGKLHGDLGDRKQAAADYREVAEMAAALAAELADGG